MERDVEMEGGRRKFGVEGGRAMWWESERDRRRGGRENRGRGRVAVGERKGKGEGERGSEAEAEVDTEAGCVSPCAYLVDMRSVTPMELSSMS